MKPTLEALWKGELYPLEDPDDYTNEKRDVESFIRKEMEALGALLDENGKKRLELLEEFYSQLLALESAGSFAKGFSIASKLLSEALSD